MSIKNVIVLGAGPCGLSTAIALCKQSAQDPSASPLRVTLVELRPKLQTIGGTINMTPLGMRYLDYLGAGQQVRDNSICLNTGIDAVSLTTGWRLGNAWGGMGARRVARFELVRSLVDAINREHADSVQILWGKRVTAISEDNEQVQLTFEDNSTLQGDILLGCDGIHSTARHLWVEPEREKQYSGRVVSMAWADKVANQGGQTASSSSSSSSSPITLLNGQPALRDTAAFSSTGGTIITTYYEPTRQNVAIAHVQRMDELPTSERDGWQILGKDQEAMRKEVIENYKGGRVNGLGELIEKCERWQVYPLYKLPPGGRWHRGRVLLLGDAAHAMNPQGESTGITIEDGILFAHVLSRRATRTVEQLFTDFESLRREAIDKHFEEAERFGKIVSSKPPGIMGVIMDLVIMVFMWVRRRQQTDRFKGDVRTLSLPA